MNKFVHLLIILFIYSQKTAFAQRQAKVPLRNQCCNITNKDAEHEFSEEVMKAFGECHQQLSSIGKLT